MGVVASLGLAVGAGAWAQFPPAPQPPPEPPPPPIAWCLAQLVSVTVPWPPTSAWMKAVGTVPGWWQYQWKWNYTFNCPGGIYDQCRICERVEVQYKSATTGQWIVAAAGVINGPSESGVCGTQTTAFRTTVYGWPLKAGTVVRVLWEFAEYNPVLGNDCFGQEYVQWDKQEWTIPEGS
jgi:hypothetical protein